MSPGRDQLLVRKEKLWGENIPPKGGMEAKLMQFGANALKIFRRINARSRHFAGNGNVNFFAIPEHAKLLQHFDLLQRTLRPGNISTNKTGAIAVDPDMTQESITDRLFRERKAIAIPRDRGA